MKKVAEEGIVSFLSFIFSYNFENICVQQNAQRLFGIFFRSQNVIMVTNGKKNDMVYPSLLIKYSLNTYKMKPVFVVYFCQNVGKICFVEGIAVIFICYLSIKTVFSETTRVCIISFIYLV